MEEVVEEVVVTKTVVLGAAAVRPGDSVDAVVPTPAEGRGGFGRLAQVWQHVCSPVPSARGVQHMGRCAPWRLGSLVPACC